MLTLAFASLGTVLATVLATGCAGNQAEFERITPPVRFATLRETASWCPTFDHAWWEAIDAAYQAYDAQVELVCVQQWEPHAESATLVAQQQLKDGSRLPKQMWSAQKSVDAALQRHRVSSSTDSNSVRAIAQRAHRFPTRERAVGHALAADAWPAGIASA